MIANLREELEQMIERARHHRDQLMPNRRRADDGLLNYWTGKIDALHLAIAVLDEYEDRT